MGRAHRVDVEGGMYHVTGRGNAQAAIFLDEQDFRVFRTIAAETVSRYGWSCHSYCMLTNHYHLLVETPEPNLSRGMLVLNGTYARRFNWRYQRYGHVFQGPYGSVLLEDDDHLLEVCRYIALNPVRAGLVGDPGEWPWSSYRSLAGLEDPPTLARVDIVHRLLGGAAGYEGFVADGLRP